MLALICLRALAICITQSSDSITHGPAIIIITIILSCATNELKCTQNNNRLCRRLLKKRPYGLFPLLISFLFSVIQSLILSGGKVKSMHSTNACIRVRNAYSSIPTVWREYNRARYHHISLRKDRDNWMIANGSVPLPQKHTC